MRVFLLLLSLFIIVPIVELALLLGVSVYMRWWWQPLLVVVVTGFVGAYLAKKQGWETWMRLRQNLSNREMPTDALLDGIMILMAGAFLITPGILTDITGFLLLFPPFRRMIKKPVTFWLKYRLFGRFQSMNPFSGSNVASLGDFVNVFTDASDVTTPNSEEIIDVPFTRKTDD